MYNAQWMNQGKHQAPSLSNDFERNDEMQILNVVTLLLLDTSATIYGVLTSVVFIAGL